MKHSITSLGPVKYLAIVAILPLCADPGLAGSEVIRDPSAWDYAPLQYYDIVVRGTVRDVSADEVSRNALWTQAAKTDRMTPVRRVTLDVLDVLRGPSVAAVWTFIVPFPYMQGYDTRYVHGQEVLIGAMYHPGLESYYLKSYYGKYVRRGEDWVCEDTPRGTRKFTDAELREKIRAVEPRSVVYDAELIVVGTVDSSAAEVITGSDSSAAEILRVQMRVDAIRKGHYEGGSIVVAMYQGGLYLPAWAKHAPDCFKPGEKWLCFLKKGDVGWYPFAGSNGLLRVTEEGLEYDRRVPYWHDATRIDELISEGGVQK